LNNSFVFLVIIFFSSIASATDPVRGVTISSVTSGGDESFEDRVLFTTVESVFDAKCGNTDYYEMDIDNAIKAKLSILLTALSTGMLVDLEIDSAKCGSYLRPKVKYITIKK
jgi:hypothetical protein